MEWWNKKRKKNGKPSSTPSEISWKRTISAWMGLMLPPENDMKTSTAHKQQCIYAIDDAHGIMASMCVVAEAFDGKKKYCNSDYFFLTFSIPAISLQWFFISSTMFFQIMMVAAVWKWTNVHIVSSGQTFTVCNGSFCGRMCATLNMLTYYFFNSSSATSFFFFFLDINECDKGISVMEAPI